jgi:eukaryotic-like serine/threonine-protein kinase
MEYGRYQVEKELGRGSMGMVYQAYDPQIDRRVALKVLRPDLVTSEGFAQRFLKEARAIGRLSHPNIVVVHDVGSDQGTIYIAMELLTGEPFHEVMRNKEFSDKEIILLGSQAARVLDYAHQHGIVHRDIKPSNIMFSADGQIKITDFGIAHIEDPSAPQQTRAGEVLGTPAYMSPEQVLGKPVDGRSDIYSLGVILYELSTGVRPFRGENLAAVFMAVTQQTPPEPAKMKPKVSPELSGIIMKCLNKAPEERFQSGKELAAALEGVGHGAVAPPVVAQPTRRPVKALAFMGLLLVLLIGGISYHFLSREAASPRPGGTTTKTEEPYQAAVKRGLLKVDSNPLGAQVFVDGGFRGPAPLQLELSQGKHEVRVTLPNYLDWEAQVEIKEGETPLAVKLRPMEETKQ